MAQLKDLYSPGFYGELSSVLTAVVPGFIPDRFNSSIFEPGFELMELKQRMRHTTKVLHEFLPADFPEAMPYLYEIIREYRRRSRTEHALAFIFLPDYIEQYGVEYYEESVQAIEYVTQFITCEYAVRPFVARYYDKMMRQFIVWTDHQSEHVRRLASEGSRPKLPWAMAVQQLKYRPVDIIPILERLMHDPSEYVRRSVANNLNDISKDHPELVLELARKWSGKQPETDSLIRHACRGLLKRGHSGILEHYGLDPHGLQVSEFVVHSPTVRIGDSLEFSFVIENKSAEIRTVRVEYGIYYLKANERHTRKVFKISERRMQPDEKLQIHRKQSFKVITTRVFYQGEHRVSLIVNGTEQERPVHSFLLVSPE